MLNYFGHIRAIFGPYQGHVLAILGPCFGYFYNILASRCLKWLKFSLVNHASQIEENHSMLNYWEYIVAMFGPYQGHVFAISTISLLLDAYTCSNCHWKVISAKYKETLWCFIIGTIVGPCFGHIRAMFWLFLQYLCF